MSRYDILNKEINKGINVDEKSNITMQGWSPNNVRRIIIGGTHAIVQYHVKGGKYPKLLEVVDIGKGVIEDKEAYQKDTYVSPLKVMVGGRILSCVEEIVFCIKNYDQQLLRRDLELGVLGNIGSRFTRLNSVSLVEMDIKDIMPHIKDSSKGGNLLIDTLIDSKMYTTQKIYEGSTDWYNYSNLRSKWYTMDKDGSVLRSYFERIKETKEVEKREGRLKDIELKKIEEQLNSLMPVLILNVKRIKDIRDLKVSTYSKLGVISQIEWGKHLNPKFEVKGFRRYIKDTQIESDMRRVDYDGLETLLRDLGGDSDVKYLREYFEELLTKDFYKRESNRYNTIDSIKILTKISRTILDILVSTVYISLGDNLNRNGDKHISYYGGSMSLADITYTRPLIEKANKIGDSDSYGTILGEGGLTLVTVEEIQRKDLINNSMKILQRIGECR